MYTITIYFSSDNYIILSIDGGLGMSKRSYDQHCTVAHALDVVGERWTLLLVRELLTGPKRFKDLLWGLPGIGTNLLAARLKALEEHGVVRRGTLPPPAGSGIYELTGLGRSLEPVVVALSRWGSRLIGELQDEDELREREPFVPPPADRRISVRKVTGRPDGKPIIDISGKDVAWSFPSATHVDVLFRDGEIEITAAKAGR